MAGKLEQTERISESFNSAADVDHQKLISHLTMPEREEVSQLRDSRDLAIDQERSAFNENYEQRIDEKVAELAAKHNTNALEYGMGGPDGNSPVPMHQLLQMADVGVREDHNSRLSDINMEYAKGLDAVIDRAREDGRYPENEQSRPTPERDSSNDRERD